MEKSKGKGKAKEKPIDLTPNLSIKVRCWRRARRNAGRRQALTGRTEANHVRVRPLPEEQAAVQRPLAM